MASSEHIKLSDFIKSVHETLRQDSNELGANEAWQKHCKNEEKLQKYASAMQELACNHWQSNSENNPRAVSRVQWTYNFIENYFTNIQIYRQKETDIALRNCICIDGLYLEHEKGTLELLDVGSCYNPFKTYDSLYVTAIDIAPASCDVYKCDFLNVPIAENSIKNEAEMTKIARSYFDVVVFSLFLEYLPLPRQRLKCCQKAYDLLKSEGILFIITPDSKHVGANAKIMKSWRFILADVGFSRVKYEKLPHLHCMVFRKCLDRRLSQRWASLQDSTTFYHEIFIPQDFKKCSFNIGCDYGKEECDVGLFEELPLCIDY